MKYCSYMILSLQIVISGLLKRTQKYSIYKFISGTACSYINRCELLFVSVVEVYSILYIVCQTHKCTLCLWSCSKEKQPNFYPWNWVFCLLIKSSLWYLSGYLEFMLLFNVTLSPISHRLDFNYLIKERKVTILDCSTWSLLKDGDSTNTRNKKVKTNVPLAWVVWNKFFYFFIKATFDCAAAFRVCFWILIK